MDCKNIIENGSIDLEKGCPICGCKKFLYVRSRRDPKKEQKTTVAEYVAKAAASEPVPVPAPAAVPVEPFEPEIPSAAPTEVKAEPQKIIDIIQSPKADNKKTEQPDKKKEAERIESVRILEKGTYDINLPVLMSRKELVMSKEEGMYMVDLPSALKMSKKKLFK
jgi:hypothetical protein